MWSRFIAIMVRNRGHCHHRAFCVCWDATSVHIKPPTMPVTNPNGCGYDDGLFPISMGARIWDFRGMDAVAGSLSWLMWRQYTWTAMCSLMGLTVVVLSAGLWACSSAALSLHLIACGIMCVIQVCIFRRHLTRRLVSRMIGGSMAQYLHQQ